MRDINKSTLKLFFVCFSTFALGSLLSTAVLSSSPPVKTKKVLKTFVTFNARIDSTRYFTRTVEIEKVYYYDSFFAFTSKDPFFKGYGKILLRYECLESIFEKWVEVDEGEKPKALNISTHRKKFY